MKKALFVVGLFVLLVACQPAKPAAPPQQTADVLEKLEAQQEIVSDEMEKEMDATMDASERFMEPGLIGGGASRYYNWDRAKFDQAVADGKTVYLEFSANWCGTCKAQEPHLIAGFAELNDPNVVGFKIPYKDSDTTAEHTELAKQYGIAYQHTKVVLKDGKQVLKSPEAWDNVRFLAEMRKLG